MFYILYFFIKLILYKTIFFILFAKKILYLHILKYINYFFYNIIASIWKKKCKKCILHYLKSKKEVIKY